MLQIADIALFSACRTLNGGDAYAIVTKVFSNPLLLAITASPEVSPPIEIQIGLEDPTKLSQKYQIRVRSTDIFRAWYFYFNTTNT